ncbi:MAG: hypothetical protein ACI37S_05685 [Candidatus Gastranaerophilaceae bacterium]
MESNKDVKICPYCGKEILIAAQKCRFCGKWLIKEDDDSEIKQENTEGNETKKCPFCGEEILSTAKKCKHCGEWQSNHKYNCNIAIGCYVFLEVLNTIIWIIVLLLAIPTVGISLLFGLIINLIFVLIYFTILLPIAIAELRGEKTVAIIILIINLLFGYTLITIIASWIWVLCLDGKITVKEAFNRLCSKE